MQAGTYSARMDRLVLSALCGYPGFTADEATPMRIRQGVRPSYQMQQLKVRAAATPNMTVIVSAGFAFIENHDLAAYGSYACVNDGDYTVTVPPAGGAGQYRKDCIVASVYDQETTGSTSEFRIELIQGPYAASAGATVRGTLPSNAQLLADIAVAPSQTSVAAGNITDIRQFTPLLGGMTPHAAAADMNHPAPGQLRYLTDTDRILYGKLDGSSGEIQKAPGAWTSWTPAWGTTTGAANPSFGNSTVDSRYTKIGRTILFYINVVFGSSTNFGSGAGTGDNWTFSLPSGFPLAVDGAPVGKASLEPASTVRAVSALAQGVPGQTTKLQLAIDGPRVDLGSTPGGLVDSITPFTWASTMKFSILGQYETTS
ncbi:hypothetical protein [Streptomyces sp. NPDC059224]|uniref:hypothetical protein n=1 Tax=Streptomyces sp. NPDC059224 TaxID=3346775 RepID=UPI0036BBB686